MEEMIVEGLGTDGMTVLKRILGNMATAWICGLDSAGWYFDKEEGCRNVYNCRWLARRNMSEPSRVQEAAWCCGSEIQ
jgi:hypothetical protein